MTHDPPGTGSLGAGDRTSTPAIVSTPPKLACTRTPTVACCPSSATRSTGVSMLPSSVICVVPTILPNPLKIASPAGSVPRRITRR
jgi:hypothetical protein